MNLSWRWLFAAGRRLWHHRCVIRDPVSGIRVAEHRASLPRAVAVAVAALTGSFAASSHVNVFERMCHPVDSLQITAATAAELEGDDMVIAVNVDGHARAYPIRMMGYHHIVNDRLGAVPIVATY